MVLNSIKLLGFDVWRQPYEREALSKWHSLNSGDEISTLRVMRADGVVVRAISLAVPENPIPLFWEDKVLARYICPPERMDEYVYWWTVIELKKDSLPLLLTTIRSEGPSKWAKKISELLESTLPIFSAGRVKPRDDLAKYSYVLYIEPELSLFDPTKDIAINAFEAAGGASKLLQFPQEIACIPHLLIDCILLAGVGYLHFEDELTLFSIKPLQPDEPSAGIALPNTAIHLLEYLFCLRIYHHLEARVESFPFFKTDISDYIKIIRTDNHSTDLYRRKFLEDRVVVGTERMNVSQMANRLTGRLKTNYVAQADKLRNSFPLQRISQHPLRYFLLDYIHDALQESQVRIDECCKLLERREAALADYLRDLVVHASTEANLLLQRSIKRLAFLALVIALLGLVIALLPDNLKHSIHTAIGYIFGSRK